ncbi:chemotaxis protein CheA [Trichlorobacter lovleyi]|uniref:chemotaxis protein CheA n=1 Tax=Trichlorobacter lovleyi TaxID=313985 RepID=UPI00223F3B7C|nr:chemotaxis protein CheA [Trichlorobacter lovleyi]QOX80292.1 chemotaxis protein CheA [Trichlorobacter lovleyi]
MTSELAEIREAFALESVEMLAEMESALLSLETTPAVGDDFNRLFRAVHTIKGSASIVAADQVEAFCHALEHLLVKVRENELPLTKELCALCLQCHDHLRKLIAAFESAEPELPPRHDQLLTMITQWQPPAIAEAAAPAEPDLPQTDESSTEESAASQKVVRVDAQKLDQLINLVVELVTASSELESHVKQTGDNASLESAAAVSLLVKKIQERAMVFRMVPVGDLFRRFQRLVHDLSSSSGKKIQLTTAGAETELDKVMAERLREPLVHLIRNAIDHGIEPPAERQAAGKPATGMIRMNAFQEAGSIVIEVRDDGRGICRERVLQRAVERGLIRPLEMVDRDPLALIFEPGFSTTEEATLLSGRGVGMDVVKRTIEELRGKIDVTSSEGQGACFQLRLPLSLALIDGFMIAVGDDSYILPMDLVDETIDLPAEAAAELLLRGYLNIRGEALPCLDLRDIVEPAVPAPLSRFIVVVKQDGRRIGLVVDLLVGEVKAVIKPLGRIYRDARIISGATILGDGTIALILDLPELLRLHGSQPS